MRGACIRASGDGHWFRACWLYELLKLLPLQGAWLIGITTQGAALGYELLPLQGVLVARGLHSPRAMNIGSGRAGYTSF